MYSYYVFLRLFVYVAVSSKTINTIHYVASTTKIMYYFKTTTRMKRGVVF